MFIPLYDINSKKHVRFQYVTLAIIIINVLIWLGGTTALNPQMEEATNTIYYAYGFIPALANGLAELPIGYDIIPQWGRYVSYAFFHGDFMHLAGNMLFLWVFGDNVEDAMGHVRYLVFYLVAAIFGALCYSYVQPDNESPLVGASAAASAIVAAYLMLHPKVKVWVLLLARIPLKISAVWVLGAWVVYQMYFFFTDATGQVAWVSHLGGILVGVMLVAPFKRKDVPLFDQNIDDTVSLDQEIEPNHDNR